jgi:hypothetical protein
MQITHSLTVEDDTELVRFWTHVVGEEFMNLQEGEAKLTEASEDVTDAAKGWFRECWGAVEWGNGMDVAEKVPKPLWKRPVSEVLELPRGNGLEMGKAPPVESKEAVYLPSNGVRTGGPFHTFLYVTMYSGYAWKGFKMS